MIWFDCSIFIFDIGVFKVIIFDFCIACTVVLFIFFVLIVILLILIEGKVDGVVILRIVVVVEEIGEVVCILIVMVGVVLIGVDKDDCEIVRVIIGLVRIWECWI